MAGLSELLIILALNGFAASAIILLFRKTRMVAEVITSFSSIVSLCISLYLLANLESSYEVFLIPHVSLLADKLSLFFSLVISLVGSAVAIYSVDYMKEAEDFARYYSLLSLFIGAMLNLVLASDLIYLLFNWELVGVCSALLIGYWWGRREARRAGIKALVMTRFGDIGLMIFSAIALYYGATNIPSIFSSHQLFSILLPFAPLLVLAAMGKSAQFPLHTWLPDAMEGPTTVSALLHAATMVKAGVYLMLRFYPMLAMSAWGVALLLAVSLVTLYLASFAGLVSMDIKRVLAFSTLSSLSLMLLAISLGEYYVAILYLFNHALFKALLFLVSGKVEHTFHTRDISKLKGLWSQGLRLETIGFLVGALSAAGLPPLSAGLVKEELFLYMANYFTNIEYYLLSFTIAFLMSLFIMRPFVFSFLGAPTKGVSHQGEKTPLMSGVNATLIALTLFAFIPTTLIANYFEAGKLSFELELLPLAGVLLGIIVAFTIPKIPVIPSARLRKIIESSLGLDVAYNKLGETFSSRLSSLASKLNTGKASEGLLGMSVLLILIMIFILVIQP